jgi:hypothetical protein
LKVAEQEGLMGKAVWLSSMVLGLAVLAAPGVSRADPEGGGGGGPGAAGPGDAASTETAQVPATARATVYFRNDVGAAFQLVDARFIMDGVELGMVVSDPERGKSYLIFTGPVAAGPHLVTTRATYQGRPRGGGIVTYTTGYTLNLDSDDVLILPRDQNLSFTIVGQQDKGLNVPLEKSITVGVEAPPPAAR